jgi:hypothetical protein
LRGQLWTRNFRWNNSSSAPVPSVRSTNAVPNAWARALLAAQFAVDFGTRPSPGLDGGPPAFGQPDQPHPRVLAGLAAHVAEPLQLAGRLGRGQVSHGDQTGFSHRSVFESRDFGGSVRWGSIRLAVGRLARLRGHGGDQFRERAVP